MNLKEIVQEITNPVSKLRIISTGYMNSSKSCLLSNKTGNYLINCGEGLQRMFHDVNFKTSHIKSILITKLDWSCVGGLHTVGKLCDVTQSFYNQNRTLQAPSNFDISQKWIRNTFLDTSFMITPHDHEKSGDFEFNKLTIKSINMLRENDAETDKNVCSYLFTLPKPEATLNIDMLMEKCKNYDIKMGPWLKKFKEGEDYTLPDGVVLKPSDYLVDNGSEKRILFLECPDMSYFNIIKTNPSLNSKDIDLVVHLGGTEAINSEPYLDWVKNYENKGCIHVYLDEKFPNVDIEKIYEIQAQLNFAENKLFPLLPMQTNEFNETIKRFDKHEKEVQKTKKIIYAKPRMDFILEPKLKLSLAGVKKLNNDTYRRIITDNYKEGDWLKQMLTPSENEIYASIEKSIDEYDNKKDTGLVETNVFPKVLFLGTSCSMTNTIRNSTGILVRINEEKSILLDCGEATIVQMNRFYGNEKLDSELVKLKGIFLSHKHLDHYAGVLGVIRARRKAFENLNLDYEKLYVLFPTTLSDYFNGLNRLFKDSIESYTTLIPNYHITSQGLKIGKNSTLVNKLNEDLDLESIMSVLVTHIHQSFGIVLNIKQKHSNKPYKLVFSGDCQPTKSLALYGNGCDLLIHEATFDTECLSEAQAHKHSTIHEAEKIGKLMNSKFTCLTHFSTRYGRIPKFSEATETNTGFAYDFMYLNADNLDLSNKMLNTLKVMFKESDLNNEADREVKRLKTSQ